MPKKESEPKQKFTCRACGEEFEDRSTLGKHIQSEHQSKEVFITEEFLPDLKLVKQDHHARIILDGIKVEGGFKVHSAKLHR